MKNFFSLKLYLEGLRKIRVAGIASAVTVVALNALLPIVGIIDSNMVMPGQVRTVSTVPTVLFAPFGLLMMLFAVVFAYSMFSYLNERSKSDFWHAIPHKRTCVYFSFIAAIYTWIVGILLVSGLVNLILWNIAKYYTASFVSFLSTFGLYFLAATMLVGFMTLAMTLTGTTISNLLIFTLLCLFVRAVGSLFTVSLMEVAPMFDISYSPLRFLQVDFFLPFSLLLDLINESNTFTDAPLILYSVFASIALLVLGAVAYHFRKSETATHSAPNKFFQHIYRCAVTLPFCLLLVYLLIVEMDASLTVVMLILILLVWIIFELMTTKKIKNVFKSIPALAALVAITLVFTGSIFIARNVIWEDTPDADEIRGISLSTRSAYTYEMVKTNDVVVEDKALNQLVAEALESTIEVAENTNRNYVGSSRHVVIHLKSGRTMGRYVSMNDMDYKTLKDGFYNSDVYRAAYLSMPTSKEIESIDLSNVNVNKDTAKRIWASFLLEYSLLSDNEKRAIKEHHSYDGYTMEYKDYGKTVGYIYLSGRSGYEDFSSSYPILYEYTPDTAAMFLEYRNAFESVSGSTATDDIDMMRDRIALAQANGRYLYGRANVSVLYGDLSLDYDSYMFDLEKGKSVDALLNLLDFLTEVKAPDDYEVENGKCILLLYLMAETDIQTQEDPNLDFDGKEVVTVDYAHMYIPIALTRAEAVEFETLWKAYVNAEVVKTPAE